MVLSIIIPVYNEEATVDEILDKISTIDFSDRGIKKEIIVVDDGSTDKTQEILEKRREKKGPDEILKIHFSLLNFGKGTAIRIGLKYATGDIILIQDADLEYDPKDYHKLIAPIIEGKTKVVLGSRFIKRKYYPGMTKSHFLGNMFLVLLTNLLYNAKITDEATCYKIATSDVFKSIDFKCREFEFCPEFIAKVCKKGLKIYEVPIHYEPRSKEEGKKIAWKDGWQAIKTLIKYRFVD